MSTDDKPRCPRCKIKLGKPMEHKLYFCPNCKMLTDAIDDGDVGYRRPETNAASKEGFEQREAARQKRRREKLMQPRGLR